MAKDYVPGPDKEFNTFQANLIKQITDNKSGWHLPTTEAADWAILTDAATGKQIIFEKAYAKVATGVFTRGEVQAKDDARAAYESSDKNDVDDCSIRVYYNRYIKNNQFVTNEQRVNMGLPVFDKTKTPTPPAGEKVVNEELTGAIESLFHLKIVSSIVTPLSKSKGKEEGVDAVEVWIALTEAEKKECPGYDSFKIAGEAQRGSCTLSFEPDKEGKRCWFIARKRFKGKTKTYGHFSAPWNSVIS
jgi:hypothetical protein